MSDRKADEPSQDNEIRITKNGILGKYISYAFRLIQDEKKSLIIKAMGQTIHKGITLAEILKRRIRGLHQITELSSVKVVDIYEPIEEGLDRVEFTRLIPSIIITLSSEKLEESHTGYQAPLSEELFAQNSAERSRDTKRGTRGRGSYRGRSNRSDVRKDDQTEERQGEYRGNYRGRGGRRSGRGNQSGGRGQDQNNERIYDNGRDRTYSNRQKKKLSPKEKLCQLK